MTSMLHRLLRVQWIYVGLLCGLAGIGYVALMAAGHGDAAFFATRHAQRFACGLVLMLIVSMLPLRGLMLAAWPVYGAALVLLGLVLRLGHTGKGAQRWLEIAGLQLQPSELMKIALVLALAAWFRRADAKRMGQIRFLLPPLLAVLLPVILILKEPNLGTAAIVLGLGGAMFFAAGLRWWVAPLLLGLGAGLMPVAYAHLHTYQQARIAIFLHPGSDPQGAGYNILQSQIALGSGGWSGRGYLRGTQSMLDFLPEKQTDFIFTVWGEQFGYRGCLAVMALLLLISLGGMAISLRCRDPFARLLGLGIACNFFFYCAVNIAMVMGAIPVGGVPLPLMSHGGSAMFTAMAGFGLLMAGYVQRDTVIES